MWLKPTLGSSGGDSLALAYLGFDDVSDQVAVPFYKSHLVGKTAFQKHAHSMVARKIRRRYEAYIFPDAEVGEVGQSAPCGSLPQRPPEAGP